MSHGQTSLRFRENSVRAMGDDALRAAMKHATGTFGSKRAEAFAPVEDVEGLRDRASAIRERVLSDLSGYVDRFVAAATRAGATVHRAVDASAAREIIAKILAGRGAKRIVKGKSMVSEEVELNAHLEAAGMEVVETDLGEYIIQMEGETPSHIIVPAIHKNRRQVGKLFAERLGVPYSDDPQVLTKIAREALREKFLSADAGISGANFAAAETGSLILFTNEGNGRMVTTVPPLHVAILSIEKMIPSLADLPDFIRLLPRSATGQPITSYVSVITGPRKAGDATGAKELHIVLLDNGRTEILAGESRDILKCIRCGACMNVCPVYRTVGGHSYGWTYPGPMGLILTALLTGMANSHPVVDASTLCGACVEVCPVRVPLVDLILQLRRRKVREGFAGPKEMRGMALFGAAAASPGRFALGQRMARILWPFARVLGGKDVAGRMPPPARTPFRRSAP
ncbi:MAG: iron-sulfur cluster-binding protein [Deltaproteobacteria bacterium]|nr:iron-sulfur cluster-binding protein [Deltaproteobacteria bacterium]